MSKMINLCSYEKIYAEDHSPRGYQLNFLSGEDHQILYRATGYLKQMRILMEQE